VRIAILGADGYLGFALSHHLLREGHSVLGVDNLKREALVEATSSYSIIRHSFESLKDLQTAELDVTNSVALRDRLEKFEPDLIVDLSRLYSPALFQQRDQLLCITNLYNTVSIVNMLASSSLRSVPLFVVTDLNSYYPSQLPVPEGPLLVHHNELEDFLPFPLKGDSLNQCTEAFVQIFLTYARNHLKLKLVDLRVGSVYGVYPSEEPLHRLHVDRFHSTVINYYCARGVRQGIVNVPQEGYYAIISLNQFVESFTYLLTKKVNKPVVHLFDRLVSFQDLIYKIKHIFAEDFGYRLRIGFFRVKTFEFTWPQFVHIERELLSDCFLSDTIELEDDLRTLIDVCFRNRKKITSLPRSLW